MEGSNLVSDTMFRALLPKDLRVMTNHYKEMCLYGVCHSFSLLQSALNRCRTKHLTSLKKQWNDCPEHYPSQRQRKQQLKLDLLEYQVEGFDGGDALHPKGRHATKCIACDPPESFQNTGIVI